ncbi:lytic transglycosylase domain-containing protein [Aneurinibacillus uraniidurans]|uniref:lytic transglycosylase domain-containing protein n=1 Tax=Aneurinibacillus uraniidurans TaxID=2966586 RepID=UPI00234AD9CD|nr:lytic transglycosylase domain-containing protein [Aneurinibacillus sp. B1]WCN37227.1 lytic transglycosylase domain-containing protein [Aneurinibacillus sp. B1]
MKWMTRKKWALFATLLVIFILLDMPWTWKLMYPVYYKEEIRKSASQYNVDPYLIMAVIQIESKFDKKRISKKGAVGLMQVMPSTADWAIKQAKLSPMASEYLDEPEVNIMLGTWYISFLYEMFERNPYAVLAAYNAGPGNVKRWLEQGKWDGRLETVSNIPFGETRHYVQRAIYYKQRYAKIYDGEF